MLPGLASTKTATRLRRAIGSDGEKEWRGKSRQTRFLERLTRRDLTESFCVGKSEKSHLRETIFFLPPSRRRFVVHYTARTSVKRPRVDGLIDSKNKPSHHFLQSGRYFQVLTAKLVSTRFEKERRRGIGVRPRDAPWCTQVAKTHAHDTVRVLLVVHSRRVTTPHAHHQATHTHPVVGANIAVHNKRTTFFARQPVPWCPALTLDARKARRESLMQEVRERRTR